MGGIQGCRATDHCLVGGLGSACGACRDCAIAPRTANRAERAGIILERRDPELEPKMAEALCVYREVAPRRATAGADEAIAVVSDDEKPGIQAIGTTAPDLPAVPGAHPTIARDHEDKRHATVTLMAGIDLLTGQVHALVRDRHRRREFIEFLGVLDTGLPHGNRHQRSFSTITPRIFLEKPKLGSRHDPRDASGSSSPPSTDPGSTSSRASLPKPPAPYSGTSALPPSTNSSSASSNSSTTSTATR
jgi:hypothetical protein